MFTGFTGSEMLSRGQGPSGAKIEKPAEEKPRSAATATLIEKGRAGLEPTRLERSGTQIRPTQPSAEARVGGRDDTSKPDAAAPRGTGLQRGASIASLAPGPTRGLSVRRPGDAAGPAPPRKDGPPRIPAQPPAQRLTEIYDDYANFDEPAPPLPPPVDSSRVANWASKIPAQAPPSSFPGSVPVSRAGSLRAGPGMRRKQSRRAPSIGGRSRQTSTVYDDEDYVSPGDYDDYDMVKVLVKLHYRDDRRGMTIDPNTPYDEFLERVTSKFGRTINGLNLKFKDEEGARISLKDDSDYELAIEMAREGAKGKPEGRLEIWCEDA